MVNPVCRSLRTSYAEAPNGTVGHIPSSLADQGSSCWFGSDHRFSPPRGTNGRSVRLCLPENSEGFAAVARWEFYTSRGSLDSFLSSSEGRLFSFRNRELILSIEGIFVTCLILPKYGLNLSTRPRDRVSNLRVALAPPPIYRKLLSKETLADG